MSIPGEEQTDNYVYDPTNPIDNTLYLDCYSIAGEMGDRSEIEERQDVLVYSTDKLDSDMEITGPLKAKLFAASSAVDTDFTVTLVDVFENEYANLIQDGIIRASYRDSDLEPSPIIPGKIYEYTVDLWATSYVVKEGHRLRVEVSSSCFNRYDRNTNTGEPFGKATRTVLAKQMVFHSREYPSHIILPLIPK
jgi:putative CocE/NonD family hydrolase